MELVGRELLESKSDDRKEKLRQGSSTAIFEQSIYTSNLRNYMDDEFLLLDHMASVIEYITISTSRCLYIKHKSFDKIFRYNSQSEVRMYHSIGPGTILAAYTAYSKKIRFTRSSEVDKRFPLGIGSSKKKYDTDYPIMSVPVMMPNESLLAVIETYRDSEVQQYDENDELITLSITNWLGAAIMKHRETVEIVSMNDLNEKVKKIMDPFFALPSKTHDKIAKLIYLLCYTVKKHLNAEKGIFYKMKNMYKYTAVVFEDTKDGYGRNPKRIQLSENDEIIKEAIHTDKIINICESKTKQQSDIRNILCMPIQVRADNIGVIQLINKISGDFTKTDEKSLELIKEYFEMILQFQNACLYSDTLLNKMRDNRELLLHQLEPCEHEIGIIKNNWENGTRQVPDNFYSFRYYPKDSSTENLVHLSLILLKQCLGNHFKKNNNMLKFALMVCHGYRPNYYHNFEHAFNVTHCMMNMIIRNTDMFSEQEVVSLTIAAFCHDIDHPGFTNSFLKVTSSCMVELYQDSILENHHSYMAALLIKHCNMFFYLKSSDYKTLMNDIHELIVSTDLSVYFRKISIITNLVVTEKFNMDDETHKMLVKGIMMTACDLSGQYKTPKVSAAVAEQLYKEFYHQGDEEKKLGIVPMSMMDRDKTFQQPQDQISFISLICIPCVDILHRFLPCAKTLINNCKDLLNYWKEIEKNCMKNEVHG